MSEDEYIYPDSDSMSGSDAGDQYDYGSDGDNYNYGSDADDGNGYGDVVDGEDMDFEVELTNLYYLAEDHYSGKRWESALVEFLKIVEKEKENPEEVSKLNEGPYSFLSMARVVMIQLKLNKHKVVVDYYKKLLAMMDMASVTANQRERAVEDTLQALSTFCKTSLSENNTNESVAGQTILMSMYSLTLEALEKTNNNRLWFKTSLTQAKLYLDMGEFQKTENVLNNLYKKCRIAKDGTELSAGNENAERASDLLELYALHINLLHQTKQFSKMKELYRKTKSEKMKSAVEDVRVMGKLRELGGKMYISAKWKKAYDEFFESFQAYNESGKANEAVTCLKYLVIANIISNQTVNPFDAREIRAFTGSAEVDAMRDLRLAYQQDDSFTNILNHPPNHIKDDVFIGLYIRPILLSIQNRVLVRIMRPYTCVSLDYLSKELSLNVEETESLLSQLILEDKVSGKIDQIDNFFYVTATEKSASDKINEELNCWGNQIFQITEALSRKISLTSN